MLATIVAIFILLIMVVLLLSARKVKEYDERQELVMNRGSKYALTTVIVLNMFFYVLSFGDSFFKIASNVHVSNKYLEWSSNICTLWYLATCIFSFRAKETSGFAVLMIVTGIVNVALGVIDYLGLWGDKPEIVEGISLGIVGFSCLSMGATIMLRNYLDKAKEGEL
ncbi:hypothetical protein [Ligilactobacillus apodemi]|uniref:Uncharacterized protein n=1 Tax=Ligilactobacillus apodemi DSM 16634 = JCM 16172 TaxID=1423724 RepID=A0A0R1TRB1_9LACO|nr:hypothetical protein [Ligilactobacillus apodemi]KRL83422.1 hypothetical protein FC32_GL000674 [Ligilactobacillus apodemi DSM 16634 = JCM 16172]MCR1901576.1 hypothetical protein [Ligilactobacillus apodemi]